MRVFALGGLVISLSVGCVRDRYQPPVDLSVRPDAAEMIPGDDGFRPVDLASTGGDLPVASDLSTPSDLATAPDLAMPLDLAMPPDLAMPRDLATPPDLATPSDLATPPDLAMPPDMSFPITQGVEIFVDNFCRMDVIPKKFDVPRGTYLKLTYYNRSRDYAVDVWMSYGGGYTDLKQGMSWAERFEHCKTPRPSTAYADITTSCSRYRLMINCL